MSAVSGVKHLNIVGYFGLCLITICKARSIYMLLLQRRKEALHRRIVQAIAAPTHGLGDAMPRPHGTVGCGRILDTTIAVMDQPIAGPTALQGHDQSIDAEFGTQVISH